MPKGRIINSCTVDYWTVYMLIMETQVNKLTASHILEQHSTVQNRTDVGWFQSLPPECVKVHIWPRQGQTLELINSWVLNPTVMPKDRIINSCTVEISDV